MQQINRIDTQHRNSIDINDYSQQNIFPSNKSRRDMPITFDVTVTDHPKIDTPKIDNEIKPITQIFSCEH